MNAYKKSASRAAFELQVKTLKKELKPLHKIASKSGHGPQLLGAYYVMAFTQLEVFIRDLFTDSIATLNSVPIKVKNIPDLMLSYHLHAHDFSHSYQKFSTDGEEKTLLKSLSLTAKKIAAWEAGTTKFPAFSIEKILAKKTYPSPDNLPHLFRRIGIDDVWALVGKYGRTDGMLLLKSLNDIRTAIAHEGNVPPGFSHSDFKDRLTQMTLVVTCLDKGVAKHFCDKTMSRSLWNKSMC